MASETFFQDGQVARLSDVYLKSVRNKKKRPLLETLRGKVAECDDSSRDTGEVGEAKIYSGEYVGLRHEYKQVLVVMPERRGYGRDDTAKALTAMRAQAEAENPGWIADQGEGWNQHRVHGIDYAVDLRRWVEPDEAPPPPPSPTTPGSILSPKKRK